MNDNRDICPKFYGGCSINEEFVCYGRFEGCDIYQDYIRKRNNAENENENKEGSECRISENPD